MRHAISCTVLKVGEKRTQLAMCGASLGSYERATAAGHMAANYLSARNVSKYVDCSECIGHVTNGTGAPITIGRLQEIERELAA